MNTDPSLRPATARNKIAFWNGYRSRRIVAGLACVASLAACTSTGPETSNPTTSAISTPTPTETARSCEPETKKPSEYNDVTATLPLASDQISILLGEKGEASKANTWKVIKEGIDQAFGQYPKGTFERYEVEAGVKTGDRSLEEARKLADQLEALASEQLGLPRDPDDAETYTSGYDDAYLWARAIRPDPTPSTPPSNPCLERST
jgi:hypothetical protein